MAKRSFYQLVWRELHWQRPYTQEQVCDILSHLASTIFSRTLLPPFHAVQLSGRPGDMADMSSTSSVQTLRTSAGSKA